MPQQLQPKTPGTPGATAPTLHAGAAAVRDCGAEQPTGEILPLSVDCHLGLIWREAWRNPRQSAFGCPVRHIRH